MTRPAAFQATYSDFKLVKTRKVAQFIFEVPIEGVDAALAVVGGMPDPGAERWFGIAPLKEEAAKAPKEKKHWRDMPPAQQAAIRCGEPIFQAFVSEKWPRLFADKDGDIIRFVRDFCGVTSRSQLNDSEQAHAFWKDLDGQYQAWKALEHA